MKELEVGLGIMKKKMEAFLITRTPIISIIATVTTDHLLGDSIDV